MRCLILYLDYIYFKELLVFLFYTNVIAASTQMYSTKFIIDYQLHMHKRSNKYLMMSFFCLCDSDEGSYSSKYEDMAFFEVDF